MAVKTADHAEPAVPVGTVAELFAGVGGFRLGLSRAGLATVFSNQWEPSTKVQHASDVYVARFGATGHTNCDVASINAISQSFDVMVGGFPCQDYSVAKAAKTATGLVGKKGVLWWEILRLALRHHPKFIFLENVDRLLQSPTSQRGRDFAVMLSTLGNAGYSVEWRVVNAADYGLPQRRVRVFIVATRLDLMPRSTSNPDDLFTGSILSDAFPVEELQPAVSSFTLDRDPVIVSDFFVSPLPKSPFGNAGIFLDNVVHSYQVKPAWRGTRLTLGDVLVAPDEVPAGYWIPDHQLDTWKYLKGAKSIERTHKESGFTYKYSEGAISFPDSTDRPSRTILTAEGGSSPSRFKHVVTQANRLRRLVPVELERLCGFPDEWTNPKLDRPLSDSRRAFFMGNALVVGLVEMVGKQLAIRLKATN